MIELTNGLITITVPKRGHRTFLESGWKIKEKSKDKNPKDNGNKETSSESKQG